MSGGEIGGLKYNGGSGLPSYGSKASTGGVLSLLRPLRGMHILSMHRKWLYGSESFAGCRCDCVAGSR